ncbi:hypothetical protein EVAR_89527_1 [Eumeta japonica]|uniref:Uncharacterized protein n=1 Tax=Eumeta variegata TaxID=151549 RepID=A0A4C1Y6T0_EUMVA|nr:hypothetical protein EVAR_89527_1 [Eumeta japonica]
MTNCLMTVHTATYDRRARRPAEVKPSRRATFLLFLLTYFQESATSLSEPFIVLSNLSEVELSSEEIALGERLPLLQADKHGEVSRLLASDTPASRMFSPLEETSYSYYLDISQKEVLTHPSGVTSKSSGFPRPLTVRGQR